jgi:hypothetical protein
LAAAAVFVVAAAVLALLLLAAAALVAAALVAVAALVLVVVMVMVMVAGKHTGWECGGWQSCACACALVLARLRSWERRHPAGIGICSPLFAPSPIPNRAGKMPALPGRKRGRHASTQNRLAPLPHLAALSRIFHPAHPHALALF